MTDQEQKTGTIVVLLVVILACLWFLIRIASQQGEVYVNVTPVSTAPPVLTQKERDDVFSRMATTSTMTAKDRERIFKQMGK